MRLTIPHSVARSLSLGIFVSIALVCAAPSYAANCGAKKGKTIVKKGSVVVAEGHTSNKSDQDDVVYACSSRYGKKAVLQSGSYATFDGFDRLAVRGRYLAVVQRFFYQGEGKDSERVRVVDLKTGRASTLNLVNQSNPALRLCDFSYTPDECLVEFSGRLLVTARGSVAFAASITEMNELGEFDPPVHAILRYEFGSRPGELRSTVLDHVQKSDLETLRLVGNRVRWSNGQVVKSAKIR